MSPIIIKSLIAAGGISIGGVGVWQLGKHMGPKTLQQKLEWDGESFYSFEDESALQNWKTLAQKYKDATSGTPTKFDGLEISNIDQNNSEGVKKFRDKCRDVARANIGSDHDSQNIERLRAWCVIPRASSQVSQVPGGSGG